RGLSPSCRLLISSQDKMPGFVIDYPGKGILRIVPASHACTGIRTSCDRFGRYGVRNRQLTDIQHRRLVSPDKVLKQLFSRPRLRTCHTGLKLRKVNEYTGMI